MSKDMSVAKTKGKPSVGREIVLIEKFFEIQKQEVEAKKEETQLNSKALDVEKDKNVHFFELEKERIKTSKEIYLKQGGSNRIYIIFLLVILLIVVAGTFTGIYLGKTEDVTKVALPIITAIAGAAGGYGFGVNKGRKDKEDEE